jgi:type VI secretion system secreted protein Hcp
MIKSMLHFRVVVWVGLALASGMLATNLWVSAGPLDPPAAPAPSSITLNQLGDKLDGVSSRLTETPGYISPYTGSGLISWRDGVELASILLTLDGQTQGAIEGGVMAEGYEGSISVLGFSHSVISPRDAASGLPTGKRQHRPVVITKRIDKSTPLLFQALVNNENIPHLHLRFYRETPEGVREHFYTIELLNASISQIEAGYPNTEAITFYYQKIIWTYEDGGVTTEDDWEAPVV